MRTKTDSLPRGVRLVERTGSFEAYYRGRDKKLYSATFNPRDHVDPKRPSDADRAKGRTLKAAVKWLTDNRPAEGKPWISPDAGKRTVREVYAEMVANAESQGKPYAPSTLALHEQAFTALSKVDATLAETAIRDLQSPQVERAVSGIAAPEMRSKARALLQRIGNFAVFRDYAAANPVKRGFSVRTREARTPADAQEKVERMPTTEEVGRLVAVIPDRYRTLVLVMAFDGLRPGEAFGLKSDDLDFDAGTITVRRSLTKGRVGRTKTGQTRTLPMVPSPGMADALRAHVERYPSDDYVFTTEEGSPIESTNFGKRVFAPAAEAAKVNDGITVNQLRHHAASYWIGRGANILQVSKLLGHAKPSITLDVYAGLFGDSLGQLMTLGGGDDLPALPAPQSEQPV